MSEYIENGCHERDDDVKNVIVHLIKGYKEIDYTQSILREEYDVHVTNEHLKDFKFMFNFLDRGCGSYKEDMELNRLSKPFVDAGIFIPELDPGF